MLQKFTTMTLACCLVLSAFGCTPVSGTDPELGNTEVVATDTTTEKDDELSSDYFTSGTVNEYRGNISAEDIKTKALSLLAEQAAIDATDSTTCSINAYPTGDSYVYDCVVYGDGIDGTAFVAFDMDGNVYAMDTNGETIVDYSDEYTSLLGEDVQYVM